MRIAVIAMDTRGGIQPYAALALSLSEAGHAVRLLAPEDFVARLAPYGISVVAMSGAAEATARSAAGVAEMGRVQRARLMREHTSTMMLEPAREILVACADVDLITGGVGGMVAGLPIAEKLGIPFLESHLHPLGPATAAFPGVLLPHVPAWTGPAGTRISHKLTAMTLRTPFAPATRAVRTKVLGLPARPDPRRDPRHGMPSVYGYSRHVVPAAPEWGPERHVTGYWTLPAPAGWQPPAALRSFLDAGDPPVCIGFGSMAGTDPDGLTDLVVAAVRHAGVRAVLLSGWGGLREATAETDDVIVLPEAPHDWLLPRCAAVVHHGGAGTTGAGFTAGIPQIVVPFGADQPFWGRRVAALGVGPAPIPRRRLSTAALAVALREATGDAAMRRRAADLGARVRAEPGPREAAAVIGDAAVRLG
ncbi:glycosyltransferase [Dactylosporangium sp. CA-139066]|uniref:glycosyltransferase n=1 Tax=Dactylosporangium sp. CA-139066 TaxID=3239930 RepID=UPI003D8F4988